MTGVGRLWLVGLIRRRYGRLIAVGTGVAVAVALLASLGSFLSSAKATMTARSIRGVAVDWQVQVSGTTPDTVARVLAAAQGQAGTRAALPVGFATSSSLEAVSASGTQTTGTARVLGLPGAYESTFPDQIRALAGTPTPGAGEVVLAQQTASNLAVKVGDRVQMARGAMAPLSFTVVGVVDLPQLDSLFQVVGAPAASGPTAPPDNVAILSDTTYHQVWDQVGAARPDLVSAQVHVARSHRLPSDPAAAYSQVVGAAHHLEAGLAGAATVGNNLAATLDAARADALYAQVLFVFLGVPGVALAAALTTTVAAGGGGRRRREQALLRLRGATAAAVLRLAAVEAALVGVGGALLGIGGALVIGALAFSGTGFGSSLAGNVAWLGAAALVGVVIAALAVLGPAWRDLRAATVRSVRLTTATASRRRQPLALRLGLDLWLLIVAAFVYRVTSAKGYSLVLAPEGVASITVDYWAFVGPAALLAGVGLVTWRIVDFGLRRGRRPLTALARPVVGPMADLAVASAARQRRLIARAATLAALALVFAVSTAVFDSTYRAQAEADARLTNGADVVASVPPGGAAVLPTAGVARLPHVTASDTLLHRYAYIGADLQDMFAVNPLTIGRVTSLQDAFFSGGSASDLLHRLGAQSDGILVSAETVKDYQLRPGDPLTLRLLDRRTSQLRPVRFRYVGIAKEFPTAPKDSFFVPNAKYVAAATGDATPTTLLLSVGGDSESTAAQVRALAGPGVTVTDIATTRGKVGSSLTAVDLSGLTRVELGFAVVLALAAGGLVVALSLTERRRDLAILYALGARGRQLRAPAAVETAVITLTGLVAGAGGGGLLAQVLTRVLSGVFDPPPAALSVPWAYLALVGAVTVAGGVGASRLAGHMATRQLTATLRDL